MIRCSCGSPLFYLTYIFLQSDDESEELEEGEWRPEEGERDKYVFEDYEDEIEDGEIRDSGQMVTWESQGI